MNYKQHIDEALNQAIARVNRVAGVEKDKGFVVKAIAQIVALTQEVFTVVERELQLTGFWESIPARKKLEAEIQKVLLSPEFKELVNGDSLPIVNNKLSK